MLDGGADGLQFLSRVCRGFFAARKFESLANPLGNGHPPRTGNALDLAVFVIL